MTSINDLFSPDLLFQIFKSLDCVETTKVRRVCKGWFEIIDEHKSFWRILHLPADSVEWDSSVITLYDEKSHSTLEKVVIEMEVTEDLEDDFFETLEKSKDTLQYLYAVFTEDLGGAYSQIDVYKVLKTFPKLVHLTTIDPYLHHNCKVRLRSVETAQDSLTHQDCTSPLQVFWTQRSEDVWEMIQPARFENLVSFHHYGWIGSPELRRFLEGPCKNLKHLGINTSYTPEDSPCERLEFPRLKVLEIDYDEEDFPNWMVFPASVKLITWSGGFDLPSISELWIIDSEGKRGIGNHCPLLKTIRLFDSPYKKAKLDSLLKALTKRSENVRAGLRVDGVQLEKIKTVICPFTTSSLESIEKLRALVEEVIDGDTLPQFIELEI